MSPSTPQRPSPRHDACAPVTLEDITTRRHVEALLRAFYTRVFEDEMLGHIFVDIAQMDLEAHLPVLADFWEKVLFNTNVYDGHMMDVHQRIHEREPLTPAHFARWLSVWDQTIDARFSGITADGAKLHAARIAVAMRSNLDRDEPE